MKRETIQRVASPTAMLVGLAEDVASFCTDTLSEDGIRVLRVSHLAAAAERIPVVMPQIVIVPENLGTEATEMLSDRCVAVGAELIEVEERPNRRSLRETLAASGQNALIRTLRRG